MVSDKDDDGDDLDDGGVPSVSDAPHSGLKQDGRKDTHTHTFRMMMVATLINKIIW